MKLYKVWYEEPGSCCSRPDSTIIGYFIDEEFAKRYSIGKGPFDTNAYVSHVGELIIEGENNGKGSPEFTH